MDKNKFDIGTCYMEKDGILNPHKILLTEKCNIFMKENITINLLQSSFKEIDNEIFEDGEESNLMDEKLTKIKLYFPKISNFLNYETNDYICKNLFDILINKTFDNIYNCYDHDNDHDHNNYIFNYKNDDSTTNFISYCFKYHNLNIMDLLEKKFPKAKIKCFPSYFMIKYPK